jgi:hypothetical protein
MKTSIRGIKHYDFTIPEIHDRVILVPEPNNEFDAKAIAVFNSVSQKIGYLPAEKNTDPRFITCFHSGLPIDSYVYAVSNKSIIIDIIFHLHHFAKQK